MLKLFGKLIKIAAFFCLGFLLSFFIAAVIGLFEPFLTLVPLILGILWRMAFGLLCFATFIALWEGLK